MHDVRKKKDAQRNYATQLGTNLLGGEKKKLGTK